MLPKLQRSPIGWYYYRCYRCCGIFLSKDDLTTIDYHREQKCRPNENLLIYIDPKVLKSYV
jgi:hypothetical protein